MARAHDLTGRRFGRLLAVRRAANRGGRVHWQCKCDCGQATTASATNLRTGNTQSCGCLSTEIHTKHGKSSTRLYKVWSYMKTRCSAPNDPHFHLYGGRGIRVCQQWQDFEAFEAWAESAGYRRGLTIERIDVNGDYCPENCTWIPKGEQSNNTRRSVLIAYRGETKHMKAWAQELGISYSLLQGRMRRGWPGDLALTTPPHTKKETAMRMSARNADEQAFVDEVQAVVPPHTRVFAAPERGTA